MEVRKDMLLKQFGQVCGVLRYVFFWTKWALIVFFVLPSAFCMAVVGMFSNWSFAKVPHDIYQFAADTAKLHAAPNGYVMVMECKDKVTIKSSASDKTIRMPAPSVACTAWEEVPKSIDAISSEIERSLWLLYALTVVMSLGCVYSFTRFRKDYGELRVQVTHG